MLRRIIKLSLRSVPRPVLQRAEWPARKFLSLVMRGTGVECRVCDASFRSFLPYGRTSLRENALCPGCLSLERHRMLWGYLKSETDFFSAPRRLLHVAPEACFIPRLKSLPHLDYITADLVSPWADVKMDLLDIPFEDGSFDAVICNHVLEHVPDDHLAMSEIFRVMKPGGMAVLQVPYDDALAETDEDPSVVDPRERERRFGQSDHVRQYGRDYPLRLEQAGFVVEAHRPAAEMSPAERHRLGYVRDEVVFVARRPLNNA